MTSVNRFRRALTMAGVATATLTVAPSADVVHAGPDTPDVPTRIEVEAGHKVFLVGHAVGVQVYSCRIWDSGPRWTFVGPRAELYGDNGAPIGTHFGGPTWQARDGSTVTGTKVDGVNVDPTAIPWLLLSAQSSAGPDGDRLASTTFIQRTNTTGGLEPPTTDCNASTVGATDLVPYTADYYFWRSASR